MSDREKLLNAVFEKVMGTAGMPHETDPDYEIWMFQTTIAALEAAGVRMVPVEATEGMLSRGSDICYDAYADEHQADEAKIYTAMIAASPYAPGETGGE